MLVCTEQEEQYMFSRCQLCADNFDNNVIENTTYSTKRIQWFQWVYKEVCIDDQEEKSDSEVENIDTEHLTNIEENDPLPTRSSQFNQTSVQEKVSDNISVTSGKRRYPLSNKTINTNNENWPSTKRRKNEVKQLKRKITEMEKTWMPRPDPGTIKYFSTIVSICTEEDIDFEDNKGDKLENIMTVLALSEDELQECYDEHSIRNTCRKVLNKVFNNELLNPTF
ncbi:unnamed protein product [Adineta steineri]|uniref:Uncharacterized protein n=1 Tax=Adineta steineri TaxID=433720 RepID=A0A819HVI5_9BILA|nr:unnamed protein product [Adineta steineri]